MSRLIDAEALMEIYMDRLSLVADRYSPDSSECGILTGAMKLLDAQPTIEPEPCEYVVSAVAVEEMLKNLLPEGSMREIEGDDAKTAICETVHDALDGLWMLPFVKPDSKELSLTQKTLDTISRQAAIDAAMKEVSDKRTHDFNAGATRAANNIKTLPPAQPKPSVCWGCNCPRMQLLEKDTTFGKWIPCSERLPEDDAEVLVYLFDRPSPYIAWVCDGCWFTEDFQVEKDNYPIAWMPLPEPYMEEGEE